MISSLFSGLLIGIAGSIHCVGMCGPLQLLVPSMDKGKKAGIKEFITYHSGRLMLYISIGVISGFLGLQLFLFQSFQWTSIILGIIMLIMAWIGLNNPNKVKAWIMIKIHQWMSSSFHSMRINPSYLLIFNMGLLNGLLPCGLVYFAILNALSTQTLSNSILSMIGFGVGTLPVFIILKGIGLKLSSSENTRKFQPWILSLVALMIIIRGLNLGIPYLSPKVELSPIHGKPSIECCNGKKNETQKKAD
jgi:sulfite exporter TauE/SafE